MKLSVHASHAKATNHTAVCVPYLMSSKVVFHFIGMQGKEETGENNTNLILSDCYRVR